MSDRYYIFSETGSVLGGPYSDLRDADDEAESRWRAKGLFAFVGTFAAWNAWWNRPGSITGFPRL